MTYVLIMLAALALLLFINNPQSKYTYKFLFIILSFCLVMITSIFLSSKSLTYQYTGNPLYTLDYNFYMQLSQVKLNYYFLIRLLHFSLILYALVCMLFTLDFLPHKYNRRISLTAVFCLIYFVTQQPSVSTWVYQTIYYHSLPPCLFIVWNTVRNGAIILLILNVCYNNLILFNAYRSTTIWLRKWQIFSYNIYMLSLNVLYMFFLLQNTVWSTDTIKISQLLLSFTGHPYFMSGNTYIMLGVFTLFITAFMIFSVFHYKTFGSIIKVKSFFLNKSAAKTKKQLRTYFHSFKNHLLTIQALSGQGLSTDSPKQKDEIFKTISSLSENTMSIITTTLNSFDYIDLDENNDDIISCIETAISGINLPENIKIYRRYNTNMKMLTFDYYHLTEMFKNILRNAADAIIAAEKTDGEITVFLNSDRDIVEISISDNGIGMDAKTRKKMFRPLFTTKVKKDYWGVGMFYVHKVISSHGGFIRVLSTPGQGTQISIFFPCDVKQKHCLRKG
ncbi:MAG: sensor histidine kinase [Clostridia bacterium]|nr:sensor histidine kinase [Clostridia bacterium]